MLREIAGQVGTALLVVLLVSLVVGQAIGQPVLLAYVESGSMEPTIDEGDGFVAIPSAIAGPPREGDVVTFYADEIEGGGLTTHRIVDETADGYVTRGDANPFTDQDGGEPPVTESDIVAKALQIGGYTVTIPHLGTGIEAFQGLMLGAIGALVGALGLGAEVSPEMIGTGIFGLGVVLFLASFRPRGGGAPERDRSRSPGSDSVDGRVITLALLVVVLAPANAAMLGPSGTTELTIDGDEVADAEGVEPGDEIEAEFDARNGGLITLLLIFEPTDEDVEIDPATPGIPAGETATATVTVPAPEPGTERTIAIEEHRYIVLFPEDVVVRLHEIHPLVALGALNLFIGGGFVGFVGGLLGFGEVRFRDTSRKTPRRVRIKQWLR